jgi:ribosomal protein L10
LAITQARKEELVAQYADLLEHTSGFVIIQSRGLPAQEIDILRASVREAGGRTRS